MVICSVKSRLSVVAALEILPRNTFSTIVQASFFARCFHICGADWHYPMNCHKTAYLKLGLFLAQALTPMDLDKLEEVCRKPKL